VFKNARVGDKVWGFVNGWGEVIAIEDSGTYSLKVKFIIGEGIRAYTVDGLYYITHERPSLFWNELKFEIPKQRVKKYRVLYLVDGEYKVSNEYYRDKAEFISFIPKGFIYLILESALLVDE